MMKQNANLWSPFDTFKTMMTLPKHFFLIFGFLVRAILCDCPRLCECKWRDGKESAVCSNANLTAIPNQLDTATQVIDLTNNFIPNLRVDEFSKIGLLNLQKIYVSRCKLKVIDKFAFRNLKNLVELDLSYNLIVAVPSHVFGSIPELRELKLAGNPIQVIPNNAFADLPQLIRLELSECRISSVDLNAFKGLEGSLTFLKLDNNKLKELPARSISGIRRLQGLELNSNPWNCSCSLRPLREWMSKQNVPFGVPPSCQYPKRLQEKPWDKLDLDEFACVPEIFAYNSKTHGVEGKNVTMTCRITGIPEPNVRWLLKNRVIANLSGTTFSNGKKLYVVHLKNNSSNLTILAADLQDAGVYICSAENKAGKAEASVTLAVSKKLVDSSVTKAMVVSAIAGTVLACTSCLAVLCAYTMRKRRANVSWRRSDRCSEDNYEKIELNHKVNAEISVVSGQKKNGDYRVVPAGDTDQEVEDDDENVTEDVEKNRKETKFWTTSRSSSPENEEIGRKNKKEPRDDLKRTFNSTCGTYNLSPMTSSRIGQSPVDASGNLLGSGFSSDLSSLAENDERKYPDLIENSSGVPQKASSEGGSVDDLSELFCTLPRKKNHQSISSRYRTTNSQSPLLPESRYNSSGESSFEGKDYVSSRRLSDSPSRLHQNPRITSKTTSYMNLRENSNATPLLEISELEHRVYSQKSSKYNNLSTYDYHAAQLEKFLEEYRSLQKELTKMKENCDNLRRERSCAHQMPSTSSEEHKDVLDPGESLSFTITEFENDLTKYLMSNPSKFCNK